MNRGGERAATRGQLNIWLVTNARLARDGRLAASTLQNVQTADALARRGHRVLLWVAQLDGDADELIARRLGLELAPGLSFLPFRPSGPRGEKKTPFHGSIARWWNLVRARRRLGVPPDAILTRSPRVLTQLDACRWTLRGARFVLEYQYPEWAQLWRAWGGRRRATLREGVTRLREWHAAERRGVLAADGVLYAAHAYEALLRRYGFGGPAAWLPSACPEPEAGARPTAPDALFDFGYIGTIAPENGLDGLLEAMRMCDGGRLLIQGGGAAEYVARLKAHAAELHGRVVFEPPVDFRDVRAAMRRCRIGLVPISRRTGCEKRQYASPLKMVEWMAAGAAVVGSNVPSLRQHADEGSPALLVAPDDAAALAEAMMRLMRGEEERARIARAGLEYAHAHSFARRAERIESFLISLIQS